MKDMICSNQTYSGIFVEFLFQISSLPHNNICPFMAEWFTDCSRQTQPWKQALVSTGDDDDQSILMVQVENSPLDRSLLQEQAQIEPLECDDGPSLPAPVPLPLSLQNFLSTDAPQRIQQEQVILSPLEPGVSSDESFQRSEKETEEEASSVTLGKNSNCIKKIGRIILENMKEYEREGEVNQGLQRMRESIRLKTERSEKKKDMGDRFNTADLRDLFSGEEQEVKLNLATTRRILSKRLREEVLSSTQMKSQSKILYLVSLKCSALRMKNKDLAWRQQLPNTMKKIPK